MSGIKDYSTTPADNDAAPPNGFPEGMAPASVNDSMRQVMADIRSWYIDPVWIDFGDTATYSSGTAFLLAGDLTARYSVGARIRAVGTTPFTIYGVIASSSYSAPNTTVTVTWDSGSMDNTLSGVALNQFSKAGAFNSAAFGTLAYQSSNLSVVLNQKKGADIASATTTDIGAATGNFVHITGTTTITGLGTVQAGTERTVEFDGILTLTHNATSLKLPTGANITTAVGDTAVFISEGSGNWRCTSYQRASGVALSLVGTPRRSLIAKQATTSGTVKTFDVSSWAEEIELFLVGVNTSSTSNLIMQLSDGTFETTGYLGAESKMTSGVASANHSTSIVLSDSSGSIVRHGHVKIVLVDPATFTYAIYGGLGNSASAITYIYFGTIELDALLTQVRFQAANGSDTFVAGFISGREWGITA